MPGSINSTSAFFNRTQSQMSALRAEAETIQRQVSTGERIERSSQDPVASAQLRAIERAERLAQVNEGNAIRAREELGSALSRMDDISLIIQRARELTVQAGNDATSDDARAAIADELLSLRESIFSDANAQSLSGRSLFGGDTDGPAYVINGSGAVTYAGDVSGGDLEIADGTNVGRGLTGPEFLNFTDQGAATDIFAFLDQLQAGLRVGGSPDPAQLARDALSGFDAAIESLSRGQTVLGVRLNWVDTVSTIETERAEDRAQEAIEIGSADLAESIVQLQQVLTVLEASQASFTRLSSISLFERL